MTHVRLLNLAGRRSCCSRCCCTWCSTRTFPNTSTRECRTGSRSTLSPRWSCQRSSGSADATIPVGAYPHLIDLCVVLLFLLDTAGNSANLYDSVTWWDDLMHVLTWIPLVIAFGLVVRERVAGRLNVAALTVGFGAVTHILWEIAEYATFVEQNAREVASAYRGTIGDLAGSLLGSMLGATLVTTWLWTVDRRLPANSARPLTRETERSAVRRASGGHPANSYVRRVCRAMSRPRADPINQAVLASVADEHFVLERARTSGAAVAFDSDRDGRRRAAPD